MIQTETVTLNDEEFIRTYSDLGHYIHGGVPEGDYAEAIDPAELGRTYTETDIALASEPTDEEYAEAGRILLGEG